MDGGPRTGPASQLQAPGEKQASYAWPVALSLLAVAALASVSFLREARAAATPEPRTWVDPAAGLVAFSTSAQGLSVVEVGSGEVRLATDGGANVRPAVLGGLAFDTRRDEVRAWSVADGRKRVTVSSPDVHRGLVDERHLVTRDRASGRIVRVFGVVR